MVFEFHLFEILKTEWIILQDQQQAHINNNKHSLKAFYVWDCKRLAATYIVELGLF